MLRVLVFLCAYTVLVCASASALPTATTAATTTVRSAGPGYEIHCIGNCHQDVHRTTTFGLALMGGALGPSDATEQDKSAYRWWLAKAQGGDTVVLTADPDSDCDYMNTFLASLTAQNSVTTICFRAREGALQPEVHQTLRKAEAVFFTGGDQSKYFTWWIDTPVITELQALVALRRTFAGSSAGLAIQGQQLYTALEGSVESPQALANPFDRDITLSDRFLAFPYMHGIITDTHFKARDRMGRLITFMARIVEQTQPQHWVHGNISKAVAVNEHTTVTLEENGQAGFIGAGPVYFLRSNGAMPQLCKEGEPLQFADIAVWRWAGEKDVMFDFSKWRAIGGGGAGTEYALSAAHGNLTSTQPGGHIY